MWRNFSTIYGVLSHLTLFCCKIIFLAIYAVLLQNLFCRDLLAFAWRDIEPKIVPVEKKNDKYQAFANGQKVSE